VDEEHGAGMHALSAILDSTHDGVETLELFQAGICCKAARPASVIFTDR
jgi:hypothetical protein